MSQLVEIQSKFDQDIETNMIQQSILDMKHLRMHWLSQRHRSRII